VKIVTWHLGFAIKMCRRDNNLLMTVKSAINMIECLEWLPLAPKGELLHQPVHSECQLAIQNGADREAGEFLASYIECQNTTISTIWEKWPGKIWNGSDKVVCCLTCWEIIRIYSCDYHTRNEMCIYLDVCQAASCRCWLHTILHHTWKHYTSL
jgi:hypothetical protein